ncbi:hd domain-containing protein [Neofusicoccum parvum]|uniref:Hd domain-containing protein n=1 Tax=Neofusicoccum parvum TaxID=310453 RepID=A0ACB5SHC1_9PEZI|nr:hd domain-containing protein [Neofusicoccum parvum]GME59801.1 hd domain-containing protein [Neofusicoccum parvum]
MADQAKSTVCLKTPLHESKPLVDSVKAYVEKYMSRFDGSHDFEHILRVLGLAKYILAETQQDGQRGLDETAIYLAALLHDVGDHKYAQPGEDPEKQIVNVLLERGASAALASKVHTIVKNVSYTNEIRDAEKVREALLEHPELGIVQDADRIDAIGAIGVGRCFTFGAAKAPERGMQGTVDHFEEKLVRLEAMMKTESGRRLAKERTERLKVFRSWWEEERSFADS